MTWLINFIRNLFGIKSAAAPPAAPAGDFGPGPAAVPPRSTPATPYIESFFSGFLLGTPIKPYQLPLGVRGYGPDGAYDPQSLDPRYYDPVRARILGDNGVYVDVATSRFIYPDGGSSPVAATQMRMFLYGLSIDPASVHIGQGDVTAHAMLTAPRSLGRHRPGAGQGGFGGAA